MMESCRWLTFLLSPFAFPPAIPLLKNAVTISLIIPGEVDLNLFNLRRPSQIHQFLSGSYQRIFPYSSDLFAIETLSDGRML